MPHSPYRRSVSPSTDNAARKSTFADLPTEIMQMITEYLLPVDAASFSLCNRTILHVLGRGRLEFPDSETRMQFLVQLQRDLPSYFFCESCSVLHPCDYIGPPGPAFQPTERLRGHLENNELPSLWRSVDVHPMHSLYDFNITHLQLAMKRHYYGPAHGISTESLSYSEVRFFEERSITTLLSVEARACFSDSLCLRIQNWALVKTASSDQFVSGIGFIWICTHLSIRDANISQFVRSKLDAYHNGRESHTTSPIFKCRMCGIDYQLQIRSCGDEGPALVITKWLDLGVGMAPTTGDEWKRHLGSSPLPETGALCADSAGNVLLLFDSKAGPSLDSLTRQNESYLVGRRFMEEMDWWDQKTWILQGGKRLPSDYPRPPAPAPDCASKLKESTDAIKDLTAQIAVLSRTVEERTQAIQHLALGRIP
ncbi:hypothetical protein MAP00_005106 [Monascus purpureus]|nr:hypothetical protein MAP00_005106 [Monascus purpureus]